MNGESDLSVLDLSVQVQPAVVAAAKLHGEDVMRISVGYLTMGGRLAVAAFLAIGVGSVASAQQPQSTSARSVGKAVGSSPKAKLSIEAVIARVRAKGFTDIEEVELEDAHWGVGAKDANGKEVEIKVDPSTGALEVEPKDEAPAVKGKPKDD